ncbi:MAG: Rrf2 family transcriptional regulator [Clostridia bacterium]|nr:Rrf2 family transcriptional regulator [Clostridia bacterium]
MKLSTRGEYGLRAMFDLAQHFGEGPIALRSIAERQDISENYLEQLIASLRRSGLVDSFRGAQGGYTLARAPDNIRIGDIIRVLEGPIAPTDCVSERDAELCDRANTCVARLVWEKLRDSIVEVLDSYTLQDMCNEFQELNKETTN